MGPPREEPAAQAPSGPAPAAPLPAPGKSEAASASEAGKTGNDESACADKEQIMNLCRFLALKSIDWLGNPPDSLWPTSGPASQERQLQAFVLLGAAAILLIWLVARIQNRLRMPRKPYQPYRLFTQVLKYHDVAFKDRLMLLALVFCQRLKQPTHMLLSPALFTRHAEQWLSGSALGAIWPKARRRLVRVAQQVFAEERVAPPSQ